MYHALGLFAAAWAVTRWPGPWPVRAGWLFAVGTLLFAGSLYALALSGVRWLGAITPLGGVAFLAGWACLILQGIDRPSNLLGRQTVFPGRAASASRRCSTPSSRGWGCACAR